MYGLLILIVGILASLITYELNSVHGKGAVRSSAIVGLLFGIPFYFAPVIGLILGPFESIPAAAIGASFAGMSSSAIMPSRRWIMVSGAVFSGIFLFSSPVFAGNGGGLGISACAAIAITRGIIAVCNRIRK